MSRDRKKNGKCKDLPVREKFLTKKKKKKNPTKIISHLALDYVDKRINVNLSSFIAARLSEKSRPFRPIRMENARRPRGAL